MTKNKATKRALLLSAISLLLCFSMLIGTTYAWFTDSVTSTGNKIVAGSLKLDLEVLENGTWTSIKDSKAPLFNYDKWEPGYTAYKILKVENEGTLALKWYAKFVSDAALSKLADVIDVYVLPSATEINAPADRDLAGYDKVGTVAEFVNTIESTTKGTLKAGEEAFLGIALKMRETAGNEYQELDLGGAFDIMILATQEAYEKDSFDEKYDENAAYTIPVRSAEEFATFLNEVKARAKQQIPGATGNKAYRENVNFVLEEDIVIDADTEFMYTDSNGAAFHFYGVKGVIDLNGHDIIIGADALMEGKSYANAALLIQYSDIDIVGEGSIVTQNKSIPVYGWANGTVNIYGGTYITNASERNESAVYVNNSSMVINVYGGDFSGSEYAFNAHDDKADAPVIILHEGVSCEKFLKNGTTDVIGSDIKNGRIVLAEGTYLKTCEENGEIVYRVEKTQEEVSYPADYDALVSAKGSSGEHALLADIVASDKIYFGDNTTNTIDLNGKTVTAQSGHLFATQGENCVLTIQGTGTVEVDSGYAGLANKGSTLNINGGTYELGETNNKGHLYSQNSGTIVINGGTYISADADTPIVYCINGFVEINGGFFRNTANPSAALLSMGNNLNYANNQKITLRGGTFVNWNPMSSAFARPWTNPDVPALIVLADGYKMVSETQANGDVWYSVVPA